MGVTRLVYYVTALTLSIGRAYAQEMPAQLDVADDLVKLCTMDNFTSQMMCKSYIRGMSEGLRLGAMITSAKRGDGFENGLFCAPSGPDDIDTDRLTFLAYVKAHPAEGKELTVGTFFKSMEAKYPCPKK